MMRHINLMTLRNMSLEIFKATAIAESSAWFGALAINMVAFCRILIPKLRKSYASANNTTIKPKAAIIRTGYR